MAQANSKKRKAVDGVTDDVRSVTAETASVGSANESSMDVYLLLNIMNYHGGTRGMELGIFGTLEKAICAWHAYCRQVYFDTAQAPAHVNALKDTIHHIHDRLDRSSL